jgi:F0F1-type ATP synthase assembly protein I
MAESDRKQRNQLLTLSSVGLMFPISIAIGYYIGKTLDGWFHTGTKLMMFFVICGVIGSFVNLYKEVQSYNRANDQDISKNPDAAAKSNDAQK